MTGRCPGCGRTGSASKISTHTVDCADWQALFLSAPEAVLDPVAEYARWTAGGRADDRAARRESAISANLQRRADAAGRFARTRDITEEDLAS